MEIMNILMNQFLICFIFIFQFAGEYQYWPCDLGVFGVLGEFPF
jgi:hypothetical protein